MTQGKDKKKGGGSTIALNKKAQHDYFIEERIEAGIALQGTEVKAIREGRVNLRDSYARVEAGEIFVYNIHISEYSHRGYAGHEPTRRRKLLLRRTEINRLIGKVAERGMTLVPMEMYFVGPWVKVEIGLGKGRKAYDKRHAIRDRQEKRDAQRAVRGDD